MPEQVLLTRTLIELADTLVDDFDVVDLLTLLVNRCVDILDIAAAGLMLVAPEGDLRLAASSSDAMRVVELFELQTQEGPCLDCHRSSEPVLHHHLSSVDSRWPTFAPVAFDAGFRSVHAVPMRLRRRSIGALNLFAADRCDLSEADVVASQALADMATISVLQHRAAVQAQLVNDQLNQALTSRVRIEQAKGVVAERLQIDMAEAFNSLRAYARNHNLLLVDVAQGVIDGSIAATALIGREDQR